MEELTSEMKERVLSLYHDSMQPARAVASFLRLPFEPVKEVIMDDLSGTLRRRWGRLCRHNGGAYDMDLALRVINDLLDGDTYEVVGKRYGLSPKVMASLVRPPRVRDFATRLAVKQQVARDAVMESILRSLAREDQIEAALDERRGELAQELYRKARVFWDRAEDKARVEKVPANELKALVYAATTAVQNAQLLGGQPTERVHQMLDSLKDMSDAELKAFVFGNDIVGEISAGAGADATDN